MEGRVSEPSSNTKQNSNFVEAKFKKLAKYNKPLYTSALTIITSCKQALVESKQELTPLAYLEAMLSIRDNFRKITQVKDEGFIYALSAILNMVPAHIIPKLYDIIYEYIDDVINKSRNTLVYKYSVVVVQILLESKTNEQWKSDEDTLNLFVRLYHMWLHSKELIRRQAIRSFTMIWQGKDLAYFSVAMSKLEDIIFKDLDQCIIKVTNRSLNVLNFLSCVLQVLPITISSNIAKKLLDYVEVENPIFKKNLYFTIEIMFASTRLSSTFVEDFLGFLLEHQPISTNIESMNNDEELMIVGYCLAVAQVAVHYKKLKGAEILQYLPTVISLISEYLTFGNRRIQNGAFNAIKNLMQYTLESQYFTNNTVVSSDKVDSLNLDMLSLISKFNDQTEMDENEGQISQTYKTMHPIKKIINVFLYCLKSRFDTCYGEVLKLIMKLVELGSKSIIEHGGIELLNTVGNLSINKPVYKTWTKWLGKFMTEFGCQTFFKESDLKIKLLDYDLTSSSFSMESRSYLLLVIKEHVKNEPLHFYVDNFLPLILELSKAQKIVKKDKEFLKHKKYETLIYQIYDILPNFCSNSERFGECLPKVVPKLEKLVQNNLSLRPVALRAICEMIDFAKNASKANLEVKKGSKYLMKKSLDFIQILSDLYIQPETSESEHYVLLKAISKLGWICKKKDLHTIFNDELTNVLEEFTEAEEEPSKKQSMDVDLGINQSDAIREKRRQVQLKLDIIICLMERIKLTKKA